MSVEPGQADFTILPGAPFREVWRLGSKADADSNTITFTDISNYALSSQAKSVSNEEDVPPASEPAAITFTVTKADPQTGDDLGRFTLSLTAEQTTEILQRYGKAQLFKRDIVIQNNDGFSFVLLYGFGRAIPSVSSIPGA